MKVDYVSDLHFNHWMYWSQNHIKWEKNTRELVNRLLRNKTGEILVLAGDFSEWNCQTVWILDECSKYYERVYFTYGNHDLYLISKSQKKKYDDSMGRLYELVDKVKYLENVVPLIKTVDEYKGKVIAGDVMWYLPKTIADWDFFMNCSNDSNYISTKGYSVKDTVRKMWKESMDWYDTLEDIKIDLFVSHVPPVHNPESNYGQNSVYMVEVPFLAAENWICGHDHSQSVFEKAGTKFYMNCIGYPSEHKKVSVNKIPNDVTDNIKTFDLKTLEI